MILKKQLDRKRASVVDTGLRALHSIPLTVMKYGSSHYVAYVIYVLSETALAFCCHLRGAICSYVSTKMPLVGPD